MVLPIPLEETLAVRSIALRNGKPFSACVLTEDQMDTAFHLGYRKDDHIVGVASFYEIGLPTQTGKGVQLRRRGVLPEYRGQHIGKAILTFGIEKLRQEGYDFLWCNAREVAYAFYEAVGFRYISDEFEIGDIGTHRRMLFLL